MWKVEMKRTLIIAITAAMVLASLPSMALGDWPMAAANPQRTSWTAEEVRGDMHPLWYRPLKAHIPYKSQVIAANGLIYVSTSAGLYAFDAANGDIEWVYPTALPLGNSPTVAGSNLYVGGFDKKIHCIAAAPEVSSLPTDSTTGYKINDQVNWTFKAEGGFDTNPLVVGNTVYMGSRDGNFYAVNTATGGLTWSYPTGGPIHLSAAYKDGVIYFAANDGCAYALNTSGSLVWKSAKLPSWGFYSWWPAITGDTLILPAARGYRVLCGPQEGSDILTKYDVGYVTPMGEELPNGSMMTTNAVNYLEQKPWRRSFYLLNTATGQERTFDVDDDDLVEYAPLMNFGTNSGNHFPAVIGPDGTIYTSNMFSDSKYNNGIAGWQVGASTITTPGHLGAGDEPLGYSMGGNVIYWTLCCDRTGGAFDATTEQKWTYYSYNLDSLAPDYDSQMTGTFESNAVQVFGGWNGIYGSHGDQNPPVPYDGKVFMRRSNCVMAWSSGGSANSPLALGQKVDVSYLEQVNVVELKQRLAEEVQKILDAGHLKPGYSVGDFPYIGKTGADNFGDYFHNPGEIFYALSLASQYLTQDMKDDVGTYLQSEYQNFGPHTYTHIGWRDGASREWFDFPPEVAADIPNNGPSAYSTHDFPGWTGPDWKWNPMTFYYVWKYAQVFGNARQVFDDIKSRMWTPPNDSVLTAYPFAHNAWVAGLTGYLELEKLAGDPESSDKRAELNRLLALRVTNFEKDNPWGPDAHEGQQVFAVSRNFIYLTPELGQYLHDNAFAAVDQAFQEYRSDAPYWFVTDWEETYNESIMHHLYDYHASFAVKAFVYNEAAGELVKYLDVPAFYRGDLFYITNLCATLQAADVNDTTPPTPAPLTWASVPTATGSSSITMTATTASDPSGVEYYFDCTAGAGGHDSGWRDGTSYEDTGLNPSTQYTYRVHARDKSSNQNTGSWSTSQSATTGPATDTTPPTPNPSTWASMPYATGSTSISMTATTASDPSGVQYYFDCTAGAGGHDSAWQSSATYQDTGLTPSTQYTYRVQTRDQSANHNTGAWSTTQSATTDQAVTPSLVSWWEFDNDATDSQGDNDGTLAGSAGYVNDSGYCVQVDGDNGDMVTVPSSADFDTTSGTWMMWVRTDGTWGTDGGSGGSGMGAATLLNRHDASGSGSGLNIKVNSDGTIGVQAKSGDTSVVNTNSTGTVTNNAWHHIAVTWEQASGGDVKIYIDGSPNGAATASAAWSFNYQTLYMCDSPDTFWEEYDGRLDEVRIYNYEMQAGEIASIYSGGRQTTDTTPPTPNPSTWATVPYATGSTSISMIATTASDPSGVQYYFDCTAGAGGHDSAWQSSATYQDTGLTPSTQYSYRVQTRDQSPNQNTGGWSTTQSATTQAPPDTTPPTPNPSTWATVPYATGSTSISMTATTASDPSGVQYFFDCTAGAGGHDSAWQSSATYQDTGLSPSTQYSYRVQTRDQSANQNTGQWSTTQSATTQAAPDTTPPTPNPSTWATVPYATGSTSISMTATTASDPSGVQYFFDCTAGAGGHDSAWQSSATYQDTGLTPSTQYSYRVQTRDQSANQNTGGWSTTQSATTQAGGTTLLTDGFETNFDKWTDGGTTDWDRATSQKYSGSYSAHAGSSDNDLISDNLNSSGYGSMTIDFWYRDDDIDADDDIYLQLYNGSAYANRLELDSTSEDTWQHATVTVNNSGGDAAYFISNFRIKFEGTSIDSGENLWIDDVVVTASGTGGDSTPPTPNPSTWATVPYATGSTSISMTATTASDPSGVQYYFDCTAGAGGHDSAWQSSATYQDTGLSPSTQYSYRVQTRDQSTNQNTGQWSTTQSATTQGAGTSHTIFDGGFQNSWAASSGVTVTSFGGYTVMDISGAAWSWHNVTRSSAVDVSATDYLEYIIYFSSASAGDQVEWHVTAPDGQEWNGTYQWLDPLSIDGVPDSTPYNMSQNAWHTIELDCSAKTWWATASTTMRYIKWQLPEDSTVYIRKVRFYSD